MSPSLAVKMLPSFRGRQYNALVNMVGDAEDRNYRVEGAPWVGMRKELDRS